MAMNTLDEDRRNTMLELKAFAEAEIAAIDGKKPEITFKKNYQFKLNEEGKLVVEKVIIAEDDAGGMMTSAPYMDASLNDPSSNQAAYGVWSGYIGSDKKPVKRKHKMFFDPKHVIDLTKNENWPELLEDYTE